MTWNVDADSWDSFPVTQSFFATGEAFAHLRYLEEKGEVERRMEGRLAHLFVVWNPLIPKRQSRKAYSRRERRHCHLKAAITNEEEGDNEDSHRC